MQHLQPNTTLQGGKYRIERVLGQGGFGITYLAIQVSLDRKVAIKELFMGGSGQAINDRRGNLVVVTNAANQASFNQQKEKFKKEALRLANLNHPNLPKVHDFFEENKTVYYVMEYIDGESLRTWLNRKGSLSETQVMNYFKQILEALCVAHQQNIWHLDIKPENIMIDRHDNAYLIDFGASKHINRFSALTTSLALAYTPGYCPPELTDLTCSDKDNFVQALKDIGPWTDIYALGATIYNLITDCIPPSSHRVLRNGDNAFIFPHNISAQIHSLIIWMMKPNLEERPQSVKDILLYLEKKTDCSSKENTALLMPLDNQVKHLGPNFIILDENNSNKPEKNLYSINILLFTYFKERNVIIDYDVVDYNLFGNMCDKYKQQIQSGQRLYIEDISKETNTPIGIILISLGWLLKEGKVDESWNLCINQTNTQISPELAGFYAGDVYNTIALASSPVDLEYVIRVIFKYESSLEAILLGFGWLMKEGKLNFENNLITLS